MHIRKAEEKDISRICEILIFVKRINFLPIFKDPYYSFNELQVLSLAKKYENKELLNEYYVFDDGIVKGLIHIKEKEIVELYVDSFFQNQGIGEQLINFGIDMGCNYLWAIEKNTSAIRFYNRHGFEFCGEKKFEEGTIEYLIKLVKTTK